MKKRILGKTGFEISEISLGTWQVGGKWGERFDHALADRILNTAVDHGVNFIDTADVYGNGESEKAVGRLIHSRNERIYVATKCGRKLSPHTDEKYQPEVLRQFVEHSLKSMNLETLDLIQLHCPPTEVYYNGEVFKALDELKKEGKIINYGVSVEKVEEALKAIQYPDLASVQIIFNMFRQKPAEVFLKEAKKKDVGIIVRVPLASGLLTGKMSTSTIFSKDDHRSFNRNGEVFDKGETFSGVDYESGLKAVEELKKFLPSKEPLAKLALRWILMFDEVSCVIPGASSAEQIASNVGAGLLSTFTPEEMAKVTEIYEKYIKASVHTFW